LSKPRASTSRPSSPSATPTRSVPNSTTKVCPSVVPLRSRPTWSASASTPTASTRKARANCSPSLPTRRVKAVPRTAALRLKSWVAAVDRRADRYNEGPRYARPFFIPAPRALMPMTPQASATARPGVNADQAELDKFAALAAQWWDPESEFKPLHAINPLRLGWIQECAGSLAGKTVLDVGCGGGILSESMAVAGARVTGIDLAERSLKVARLHGLESGVQVEYRAVPVEDLAIEQPSHYDVVTCMEMLEHVPDPGSVVRACAELVKPGGWVFFSTLNRNAKSFLYAIVGAEYVLRLLPRGTHS